MFVTAFACSYPEKISGVLSVNGMQAKDLACTPDRQSMQYFMDL